MTAGVFTHYSAPPITAPQSRAPRSLRIASRADQRIMM